MGIPDANGRSLTSLKVFNFFMFSAMSVFGTFFPLYLQNIGINKIAIGALVAGGPLISIVANPFWGYQSDRMQNIKRTIIILMACNLIVAQIVFQMHSYFYIFVTMLAFYFFQTPLFSQSSSLILNTIEGTPLKFGSFRQWGSYGWAFAAISAGPLMEAIGIKLLWLPVTVIYLIAIGIAFQLPKSAGGRTGKFSNAGYRQVFQNGHFLAFILLGVLISVPNMMNSTFVSLYITDLGGHANLIGLAGFFASIFEAVVYLLFDRFLKKTNTFMVACLVAVSILFCIRWVLMSLAVSPIQLILIQSLHCLTFGGYFYVGTQLTAKFVPKEYRATGQAAFALTWGGLSGFFAGLLGGWLYEHMGAQFMYAFCAGLTLLGVLGFIILLLRVRKLEPSASQTLSA
jgi:MFS transporter, PPP family, 3-phenylpropionic acid transporter